MKIFLLAIFCLNITLAKAGDLLTTAIILSAMEESSPPIKKDRYSEMISVIKEKLPAKGFYASVDKMEFDVPFEDLKYYESYFKNAGYSNVSIKNNKIYFDFTGHSIMRKKFDLQYQNQEKLLYKIIGSCFLLFVLLKIGQFYIESKVDSIVSQINEKLLKKAQENSLKNVTLYSTERLSFSEKWQLYLTYKRIKQ